ncbi:alpha/beta-hydrolase [Coprinellus micaceus]|uniref:Alpha/beta-hydrolase n=1 Tax=Coprinellus micaceus TaxID=71717 RepID=A0A4Y7SEE6_COPMI|nr:alpha/beta-hydrolase [Coprinellus micaceus]
MLLLAFVPLLHCLLALAAVTPRDSAVLAGPIGPDCVDGAKHGGEARGTNVTFADVPTYYAEPSEPSGNVILFFSDIYSPFYVNNQLLQDYFAGEGYHVLGIDYFFGDPIQAHDGEPGFNQAAWIEKSRKQAAESLPKWIEAVQEKYGPEAKYTAVGYCFGGPYALEISATDKVVAGAFAHPSGLTEDHFQNLTSRSTYPLLIIASENDGAFPTASRNRAVDILAAKKAKYHVQVFSGVSHGFATRADLSDENAVWAKDQSARGVVEWFNRFST